MAEELSDHRWYLDIVGESNSGLYDTKFLHVAAKKFSNTGKSVDLLRCLGREDRDLKEVPAKEVVMTDEVVFLSVDLDALSPFAELLTLLSRPGLQTSIEHPCRISVSNLNGIVACSHH